ncbi:MAG: hypothetical protein ABGY42_14435, partial [bacterium]
LAQEQKYSKNRFQYKLVYSHLARQHLDHRPTRAPRRPITSALSLRISLQKPLRTQARRPFTFQEAMRIPAYLTHRSHHRPPATGQGRERVFPAVRPALAVESW